MSAPAISAPETPERDLELARLAVRGGHGAFEAVIERFGPDVLRFLTRVLGRREDAMDAYQDTFLSAFRSIHTLRDPARLRGWILQIAANAARKRFRTARTSPTLQAIPEHDEPVDTHAESIPNTLADKESAEKIRGAIARLPDRQREVLSLRTDAGLTYAEIADALEIREDNARAHHYQALKSLRRMVEPPGRPSTDRDRQARDPAASRTSPPLRRPR